MQSAFSNNKLIKDDIKNPFSKDYTGQLEQAAKSFTALIEAKARNNPLVLFLNAPWGAGKTTFSDMWGQSLLNDGKLAVKFDAWKADHSDNPLISLISQVCGQLEEQVGKKEGNSLKTAALSLGKALIPAAIKFGINAATELAQISGATKEFTKDLTTNANKIIENSIENEILNHNKKTNTIDNFKNVLREIAKNQTLFVFVDELDRCKPTFAIALLEIIKHIFDVDNVCFILSTNIEALSNSVQTIYGHDEVESKSYLERFVDFSLILPEPDLEKFIEYQLKRFNIDLDRSEDNDLFVKTIITCCNSARLPLRVVEKYLRELQLFIEVNSIIDDSKKIPVVYYPIIACILVKNRMFDGVAITNLEQTLLTDELYRWRYDFFMNSSSSEELLKQAQKLNEQIYAIKSKSSYNADEAKVLARLEGIRDDIIYDIHGGTEPNMKQYLVGKISKINAYINHHENAKQITNLLEWTQVSITTQNQQTATAT